MSAVINVARPKFCKSQKVEFLGGLGTVIQCCRNSGQWSYLVEMEACSEPEMDKIGYETTILLFETDIILLKDYPLIA